MHYVSYLHQKETKRGGSVMHYITHLYQREKKKGGSIMHYISHLHQREKKRGVSIMHYVSYLHQREKKRGGSIMHYVSHLHQREKERGGSIMRYVSHLNKSKLNFLCMRKATVLYWLAINQRCNWHPNWIKLLSCKISEWNWQVYLFTSFMFLAAHFMRNLYMNIW